MSNFWRLLRNDLRLQARHPAEWAALALFFIIVIVILPFAIGPDPDLLRRLAPGLIWLAALLMSLLSLDRLFIADARDGVLDLILLSPFPLPLIVFSKLFAQIIVMFLALAVILAPAALLLGMSFGLLPVLLVSIVLGVPVLVLLGGIAASVTVTLHRNPALLTLLLVPFYIPVLIFAVSACDARLMNADPLPHLLLLGALLVLLLPAAPFIIAAALRNSD